MRALLTFLLAAPLPLLHAQVVPEVRRAEPAGPVAPEVRRAEPAAVPTPTAATATTEGMEEYRAAPATGPMDPVSQIFAQANGFYGKKLYDMAVPKYQEFLQAGRTGPDRQAALFRMGESLRALDRGPEAAGYFRQLLAENSTGDFVGPAAYRLGEMQYAARDFDGAATSFALASHHVRDPKLRLASKFFEGRSLDAGGRKSEALSAYRAVAAVKEDNPYRDRAMFDLAEADARTGLTDSAFRQFRNLAGTAANPVIRASASVKAGLLAIDNREFDEARPLLEAAAANREVAQWSAAALSGLVRLDYETENYDAAAKRAEEILPQLPPESRPDVLLLAANARRQLGEQSAALALYDRLSAEFPESEAARDARFHRLVSLVAQKDERALAQIDFFLEASTDEGERAKATLLKAELLFAQNRYAEAAELYQQASTMSGADKYRGDALYKLAWCRLQEKKYDEAVQVLTRFLLQFPRHPQVGSAYAQRAVAQLETGDKAAALSDFEAVIDRFPGAKEREDSMLQRALLLGSMQRPAEMSAAFERLLAEYPESESAAQANFWIGYSAAEAKKYREALAPLEKSRQLDAEKYGERATLRLLMCHYYLQDREAAAREAVALGPDKAPAEVRSWLGLSAAEAGDHAQAVKFLAPLAAADGASEDLRMALATSQLASDDFAAAAATTEKLLPRLQDPKAKARANLLLAEAHIGMKDAEKAKAAAEEALRQQPEGRLNAEARLVNARALLAQNRPDDAARAFMAVALLYDDKTLTPQALVLAEQAYLQAENKADAERARQELQRRFPDYKPPARL